MAEDSADKLPAADMGVHHHTDAGALTVLLQDDTGGLQVYQNGHWHDIPPVEGIDPKKQDKANKGRGAKKESKEVDNCVQPLLDAISQVTGVAATYNGYPAGYRAGQIAGVQAVRLRDKRPGSGDRFLKAFGKPARLLACS